MQNERLVVLKHFKALRFGSPGNGVLSEGCQIVTLSQTTISDSELRGASIDACRAEVSNCVVSGNRTAGADMVFPGNDADEGKAEHECLSWLAADRISTSLPAPSVHPSVTGCRHGLDHEFGLLTQIHLEKERQTSFGSCSR